MCVCVGGSSTCVFKKASEIIMYYQSIDNSDEVQIAAVRAAVVVVVIMVNFQIFQVVVKQSMV